MAHINIEIKARCVGHDRIRDILVSEHAEYKGEDHQVDIYFNSRVRRFGNCRKDTGDLFY